MQVSNIVNTKANMIRHFFHGTTAKEKFAKVRYSLSLVELSVLISDFISLSLINLRNT